MQSGKRTRYTGLWAVMLGCGFSAAVSGGPIPLTFESGTLAGLTFSGQGNAAVIGSLGTLTPSFGTQMAILSNGPGDAGGSFDEATLLSDPFTLVGSDVLSFSFLRLTGEFSGTLADRSRLDSFEVLLLDGGGSPVSVLHASTVDDTAFAAIMGGPISTGGGDTFFDATAWLPISVTGMTGTFRLSFVVRDTGDNSFDSAFLIDAQAQGGSTVPEPGTLSMVVLAGAAGLMASRRGNRRL